MLRDGGNDLVSSCGYDFALESINEYDNNQQSTIKQ